jgi:hypothetical protein
LNYHEWTSQSVLTAPLCFSDKYLIFQLFKDHFAARFHSSTAVLNRNF